MPWHPRPESTAVPMTSWFPAREGLVALLLRPPQAAVRATSVGSSCCCTDPPGDCTGHLRDARPRFLTLWLGQAFLHGQQALTLPGRCQLGPFGWGSFLSPHRPGGGGDGVRTWAALKASFGLTLSLRLFLPKTKKRKGPAVLSKLGNQS